MKKSPITRLAFFALSLLFLSIVIASCEYEFIEADTPDPTVTVKFAEEIIPIFNNSNNCTSPSCHNGGSALPDFRTAQAYNSIVPNLINSTTPELSKIYMYPDPASSNHGFKKYTPKQAALVLNWIKQGALNN